MLTSLIIVFGALTSVGCCIIPCAGGLIQRLVETALSKQPLPLPYEPKLLVLEDQEHQSRLLTGFEEA